MVRLIQVLAIAAFSVAAGALLPLPLAEWAVVNLGYVYIATLAALFALNLFFSLDRFRMVIRWGRSLSWAEWLLIAVSSLLCLTAEPFAFKVMMDEPVLSVLGEMLHFERVPVHPESAFSVDAAYTFGEASLNKRPLFFPFLLSLCHDLLGYRWENVFLLNGVMTILAIVLLYSIGQRLLSSAGGPVSVGFLVGLPLFGQIATSGHFEMVNIVLILALIQLASLYLNQATPSRFASLVLASLLLAQVRYESGLFVLGTAAVIALGWWQSRAIQLPRFALGVPVAALPILLHFRLQSFDSGVWQSGPNGRDQLFDLSYLSENLIHAWDYLLNPAYSYSNSFLLGSLGLLVIPSTPLLIRRFLVARAPQPVNPDNRSALDSNMGIATLIYGLCLIGVFLLVLCFNYGVFTWAPTSRLSLSYQLVAILVGLVLLRLYPRLTTVATALFMVVGAGLYPVLNDIDGDLAPSLAVTSLVILCWGLAMAWFWRRTAALTVCFLAVVWTLAIFVSLPKARSHAYLLEYDSFHEARMARDFFDRYGHEQILFVGNVNQYALLERVDTASLGSIKPQEVLNHLLSGHYDDAVTLVRYTVDPKSGHFVPYNADFVVTGDYRTEVLEERRYSRFTRGRIERITHVRDAGSGEFVSVDELRERLGVYHDEWYEVCPNPAASLQ